METSADDGRVYIPKDLRERLGSRFELVDRGDSLLLIPVPADPLEQLRNDWNNVDKSVEDLREIGRKAAEELAGN